jgi:mannose-6-phosphate isomerase
MLYPLKFQPIYKEKIWGGTRLKSLFNKDFSPLPNCGESWELSGVNENISVVSNGFLASNSLNELIEIYMGELVGDKVYEQHGNEFPLLVKLLDTKNFLSIQVHPEDVYASQHHNSYGKTEMWIILEAGEESEIITGFNQQVTKEQYLHHLENKSLRDILNVEKARKGDVYYIPAGRIHAIGGDVTLLEIQQTSDITYRVYDWDRKDEKGEYRELHTDKAMDVLDFKKYDQYKIDYLLKENQPAELVSCPYFTTRMLELSKQKEIDYVFVDSFVILSCVEGNCELTWSGGKEDLKAGELVLLPAEIKSITLTPKGKCKLVETYIS